MIIISHCNHVYGDVVLCNQEWLFATPLNAHYLTRQERLESNVRSYPRKLPLAIASARGAWVTDVEGKTYLDCLAGAGTLALGHNHDAVTSSLRQFLDSGLPMHTLDLTTPLKDAFSEAVLALLPDGGQDYCLQFCGPSGADAVEAAIKLAKTATGRSGIISFSGGYHGMTHGALSATGNTGPKDPVPGLMPGVQFLPYPHEYRCPLGIGGTEGIQALSQYFARFIEDVESGVSRPAAVILEAVQGEGGVNPAPVSWLRAVREITRRHGILLITDEVQCGFVRTGKMFAYEYAEIEPDIIVMSKAVGGGLPMALLGIKRAIDAWQPGAHTGTFRGNQMAMATGLATLNILTRPGFCEQVTERGERLRQQLILLSAQYPALAQVRGRGLMLGIEIVDERGTTDHLGSYPGDTSLAAAIQQHCFRQGLLLERGGRSGNVVRFLPPLIISEEECQVVVERFRSAVECACAEYRQ
ncbi:diaminobutyrate--2-oxoglutarate transaminase [Salmonella enterica subsp. enterica serovar Ball]|nr:diaminobutyrate--2-oxoglutarate transaminase [Salmonella enterica subsp. enterica serovar Ball]